MNQLSLLLYAGDVASAIGSFFVIFGIILFIFSVVCVISSVYVQSELRFYHDSIEKVQKELRFTRNARRWAIVGLVGCFILWATSAFVPSKETVYAIAASQVGEQVLQSPTGSLATTALNSWLMKQIAANSKPADTASNTAN